MADRLSISGTLYSDQGLHTCSFLKSFFCLYYKIYWKCKIILSFQSHLEGGKNPVIFLSGKYDR